MTIDDFTIKPIEQHSFLVTGFSRHTLSQTSFSRATTAEAGRNHTDTTRTRLQNNTAVDARALAPRRSELSISDEDSGLSDSDPEPSSDDAVCLSEDVVRRQTFEQYSGCFSVRRLESRYIRDIGRRVDFEKKIFGLRTISPVGASLSPPTLLLEIQPLLTSQLFQPLLSDTSEHLKGFFVPLIRSPSITGNKPF